ncbi:MAG: co-chaperone GroES [Rickettsia sp.]|nr:co-chaperone GroES [Rickettsia sp.]
MKFKPLYDRVAIKPDTQESKTASGIIIPDSAKEKPLRGTVLAVGQGNLDQNGKSIPLTVKTGDVVLYGKWGGTEVKIDNEEIIVIKESDIMGIINS